LYQRNSKPYQDVNSYSIETTGTSVRFGVPFTETDTVFLGVGVDRTSIVTGNFLPEVYENFANKFGYTSNSVPLTAGWARDTRDSALVPSSGRVMRASAEWSVAGELRYIRGSAQFQQFYPLSRKTTLAFNSDVALGVGTNGLDYPVFKNFYSGGLGSVRGFEQGTLTTGKQRSAVLGTPDSYAVGGGKKVNFNAEVLSPLPGGGNDRTLRWYTFVDAGGVYDVDESLDLTAMRSSFGVGLSWISPVGPLRLAFARPLTKFENDRVQFMQFQIGTAF
jgi:outer membrane protein insertion porin family